MAYRNYICRPRNWERESLRAPSLQSTPGNRLLNFLLEVMTDEQNICFKFASHDSIMVTHLSKGIRE